MYMLSIMPQLFSYQILAFALLRLVVAFVSFLSGRARYKNGHKIVSIFYFLASVFLLLGLYTQVVALLSIILMIFSYYQIDRKTGMTAEQKLLSLVCLVILISLLFTGPGFLAIDKPL